MHLDHYFAYEMMLPLLEITIRSSSETLKNICCETYKLLVLQASLQKADPTDRPLKSLGHFTRNETATLTTLYYYFKLAGDTMPNEKLSQLAIRADQNSKMKTIWHTFQLHDTTARLIIYTNLLEQLKKDKNDIGISILTSSFYKQEFWGRFDAEIS